MQNLRLGAVPSSFYFWPAVAMAAVGVFFFGWAATLAGGDWLGQGMWAVLFSVIASVLISSAVRESRRTLRVRR